MLKSLLKKLFGLFSAFALAFTFFVSPVFAQINSQSLKVGSTIGNVKSLWGLFVFVVGVMQKIGWAGVIVGITIILALLVYRLISTDDAEAMKTVQGGITKAVLIVIIGLILISAGFIIETVSGLFGGTINTEQGNKYVPAELDVDTTTP